MKPLLALEEAQERLLALATPGGIETVPVGEALDRYLAVPLHARRTQPAHPLSAMDGWAVKQTDMPGPWKVTGESAAGHPATIAIGPKEAIRISTGAILPEGADMVVLQEDCEFDGEALTFHGDPPRPLGRHVRPRGQDFEEGDAILGAGAKVTPATLALAISSGHPEIPVFRKPSVVVVDSGDELIKAGEPLSEGQIPASNGPMLCAMLARFPCEVTLAGPVADDIDAIVATLDSAKDADLILTSGGASVGDHDLMRPALEKVGADIDFWRVAMKPGKPIMVGQRGQQTIIGLPGNPVSSFVTAHLFALPYVRALLGAPAPLPNFSSARTLSDLPATGKRAEFLRAVHKADGVELIALQDSGALLPLASANALIFRPPFSETALAGSEIRFIRIG